MTTPSHSQSLSKSLPGNNISLEIINKPFRDFYISVRDISASTGYSQEVELYTKESLDYLGKERESPEPTLPGRSTTLNFKFRPIKKISACVVIKTYRPWQSGSESYKAFVIMFD